MTRRDFGNWLSYVCAMALLAIAVVLCLVLWILGLRTGGVLALFTSVVFILAIGAFLGIYLSRDDGDLGS